LPVNENKTTNTESTGIYGKYILTILFLIKIEIIYSLVKGMGAKYYKSTYHKEKVDTDISMLKIF